MVLDMNTNNVYYLDMSAITGDTTINLYNENNLATEDILTDWGDGTQDSNLTHIYSTAGEYVVVSNLQLGGNQNTTIRPYLTNATIYYKTTLQYLFESCSKLKTVTFTDNFINILNQQETQSFLRMFNACSSLTDTNEEQWKKLKPNNMAQTFNSCASLITLDLENFDTSKVKSFSSVFNGCSNLIEIKGVENWDVSNCTNMINMFNGCSLLTSLDLSSWDTRQCTSMTGMFRNTTSLLNVNVLNFNIDKVTSMDYMFSNCAVKQLDVSSFKITDSTTYLAQMFVDSVNLESVDLSNFTRITTLPTYLFRNNTNLKTIGMLYSSAESINNLLSVGFQNTTLRNGITIYYHDADPSQLTPVEGVTFKKYSIPTTIQLPPHIQLHSLPDGTRDEVDIKTGILTRNVGYIVLDGSEEWVATEHRFELNGNFNFKTDNWTRIISDRYNSYDMLDISNQYDSYIIGNGWSSTIFVRDVELFPTPITQIKEFKEYLSKNPIKGIYTIVVPTTEQLILNYNNSCDYGRILPTGMCDKYSVVDSMYTQTMTSILLDGANTWDAMEEFENTVKFTATGTTVGVENLNMLGAGGLYCDNDLFPNINDDSDVEHCRVDEAGNKFYIYISKDRLMSPDLIGWQIWLQANPFNLIYELAEHLTYIKPYEELVPTQARWEGMDCMKDGAIKYHANNSDNLTMYPTLEYVAPSINNFEVTMLEPNTDYTIYAEGINTNDTINLGGTDINFNNGTVYTSGDNQWLRIDNNDSFYNMVITKGDTTGEVVSYFEGMASVENPKVKTSNNTDCYIMSIEENCYYTAGAGKLTTSTNFDTYNIYLNNSATVLLTAIGGNLSDLSFWSENNEYISGTNALNYTITVPTNARYFKIGVQHGVTSVVINGFDVINGYKESTVSYTDLKLRSLPNGVKDTINVVTGEYVQRVGEVVLDGTNTPDIMFLEPNRAEGYTVFPMNINTLFSNKPINNQDNSTLISNNSLISNNFNYVFNAYTSRLGGRWMSTNVTYFVFSISNEELESLDTDGFNKWLVQNPTTIQYQLAEPITTKLDPQTLLAYTDGTINLSSDTGLLPTTHYTVPSTNTFHLPSMKTGTRYTLKYPSASGSITIGDINYSISSDSMLFTTPLKINGDTSAIIFSDTNPENVVLLEGAYNKREVPFFTGVKSVRNPNITIIDQLSTESTTYNCETEIELRGLPNGVADKLDIIKGKLTTNVGIRPYQEGDENLSNIWTDGYETVYALSSPVVTNVTIDQPTVTTNSLIELSSDYLIPQLNYRAPSSNNFPLDLLQPNATYTLYADTLTSGSYTLGGTKTGIYSQPHTIILGDMTDNLLTFNGDLGLSNVMLVKGNSLKTTLPPYFLGIRSVTDGHLLVEGMAGEMNEITFDEGIVLRDCNGVKDTIDLITCTLTKRTGEITLTGAEGWYRADNESTTDHNVFKLTLGGLKEALVMCDTLQSVFDTKMMDCIHAHTNELCIVIANATIGGNTVNALKSWLNQHPTTVVYQLRVPIEVQLENTWTTLPPTSYSNQTEISSTVSTNSLKPMISVTIATTTLEEIVSNLEAQNAELEAENMATMLALTSVYETMAAPMAASTMSLDDEVSTVNLSDDKDGNSVNGMSVSPIGMVYVNLIRKGLKTIEQVPYNLQPEVIYALRGME